MERTYGLLQRCGMSETDDYLEISGIATTPNIDRMNRSFDPMGAKYQTPMPLLWQHDDEKPVGTISMAKATPNGIPFKARIPKVKEAGKLKERVDEALHSLKYGLISSVSIGARVLDGGMDYDEKGTLMISAWEWLELSLVTIPANDQAILAAVERQDEKVLAALGKSSQSSLTAKAATATKRKPIMLVGRKS